MESETKRKRTSCDSKRKTAQNVCISQVKKERKPQIIAVASSRRQQKGKKNIDEAEKERQNKLSFCQRRLISLIPLVSEALIMFLLVLSNSN